MKFLTTIIVDGNNTGIEVPDSVMASLGTAKRYAVTVTLEDFSYRSSVSVYKGRNLISLSAANRAAAGVVGGQQVEVDLQLDDAPREVTIPDDLKHALETAPEAKTAFDALSFTNRNRIALSIGSAKTEATRSRRVEKALEELGG